MMDEVNDQYGIYSESGIALGVYDDFAIPNPTPSPTSSPGLDGVQTGKQTARPKPKPLPSHVSITTKTPISKSVAMGSATNQSVASAIKTRRALLTNNLLQLQHTAQPEASGAHTISLEPVTQPAQATVQAQAKPRQEPTRPKLGLVGVSKVAEIRFNRELEKKTKQEEDAWQSEVDKEIFAATKVTHRNVPELSGLEVSTEAADKDVQASANK